MWNTCDFTKNTCGDAAKYGGNIIDSIWNLDNGKNFVQLFYNEIITSVSHVVRLRLYNATIIHTNDSVLRACQIS